MLRKTLFSIGVLMVVSYFLAPLFSCHLDSVVLWWGLILSFAIAFERWRYADDASGLEQGHSVSRNREIAELGEEWEASEERFFDPETNRPMRVYYHRHSGERRYLCEAPE